MRIRSVWVVFFCAAKPVEHYLRVCYGSPSQHNSKIILSEWVLCWGRFWFLARGSLWQVHMRSDGWMVQCRQAGMQATNEGRFGFFLTFCWIASNAYKAIKCWNLLLAVASNDWTWIVCAIKSWILFNRRQTLFATKLTLDKNALAREFYKVSIQIHMHWWWNDSILMIILLVKKFIFYRMCTLL